MRETIFLTILFFIFLGNQALSIQTKEELTQQIESIDKAIAQNPENFTLYYERGMLYDKLNDFEKANRDVSYSVKLYFENPNKKLREVCAKACYYLADDFFYRNSQKDRALEYVEKGLVIEPEDKNLQIIEASIWGAYPNRRENAKKKFEGFIEQYPNDEKLVFHYAKFLEREDLERAKIYFEKTVEINRYNEDALFALGSYYTNKAHNIYKNDGDAGAVLKNAETGIAYFERVHEIRPYDTEVIEILIHFYGYLYRNDDIERMEKKLESLSQ